MLTNLVYIIDAAEDTRLTQSSLTQSSLVFRAVLLPRVTLSRRGTLFTLLVI